jgi:V/A-type H+/Na+-transporting ATPase subunit I
MIVPMTKYSLLLFHHDKDVVIEQLMDLGVVQINQTKEEAEPDKLTGIIREIEEAIKRFKRRKTTTNGTVPIGETEFPSLAEVAAMEKELERNVHEAEALAIEIKLLEPWGEFMPESIGKLEKFTGLEVKFFQFPENRFNPAWQKEYALEIINNVNGNLYFVILKKPDQELPLSPIALPWSSLESLKEKRNACLDAVRSLNEKLDQYAANLTNGLSYKLAEAKDQLEFLKAKNNVHPMAEDKVSVIEAWCPVSAEKNLLSFLDANKIVYTRITPDKNEVAPVLLRNNWFFRLFEPIGAMFSLPRYSELDLTVFFAPFFLLFFGLCLGDVGYGVVILLIATVLKLKPNTGYRDYLSLIQFFGVSTIIAGFISGTLFGLEMKHHEAFKNWTAFFLNQDQLFRLALVIGFIQIMFGLSIQAYKLWIFRGFTFALSKIGWMLLLISLGDLYVTEFFPGVSKIVVWPALMLIVFFGAPEKGWLASFGFGLADLYNITGVLGDLLSYIRLFALGVSSAILGLVVNSIALSARETPYVGIVLFLLVLVIGHTANLLLSSLSAFVHPMRLTFVEFYKNSGFEGGGKPFVPFRRNTTKENTSH